MAATPAKALEGNPKTGTSIVKSAPPKETARITVKPNLPVAVKPVGNIPTAKPTVGAVPVVAAAAGAAVAAGAVAMAAKPSVGGKPATTIVKGSGAKVAVAAPKPVVASAGTAAVPTTSAQFQEEGSTTLTTALAGVLAALTWGTATVLILSYLAII
jgi:hypothetical protein